VPRVNRSRKRWLWCLAVLLAGLAAIGCGGDDDSDGGDRAPAGGGAEAGDGKSADAGSEQEREGYDGFVRQFRRLTGVALKPVPGDLFGTRLDVPPQPNRFVRFGVYSFMWTRDDRRKDEYLENTEADDDGIHWIRTGTSFSANKPFGDRLVLRWVGRQERRTTAQWDRLERAVEAAFEGDPSMLPDEEQPCSHRDLDPLEGEAGGCALNGLPITFVSADDKLETSTFEVNVLGVDEAKELRFRGLAPLVAKGRFFLVAYRVKNVSSHPIRFVHPELRLDGKTVAELPEAAGLLPRSGKLPLAPGATLEGQSAFDVPSGADPSGGAFVLPAEREGKADPHTQLAQGWVRLAGAKRGLPRRSKGAQQRQ
jgi:hypothetical protein